MITWSYLSLCLRKKIRLGGWMTARFAIIHHWSGRLLGREKLLDCWVHSSPREFWNSSFDSPTLWGVRRLRAPTHRKASELIRTPSEVGLLAKQIKEQRTFGTSLRECQGQDQQLLHWDPSFIWWHPDTWFTEVLCNSASDTAWHGLL